MSTDVYYRKKNFVVQQLQLCESLPSEKILTVPLQIIFVALLVATVLVGL